MDVYDEREKRELYLRLRSPKERFRLRESAVDEDAGTTAAVGGVPTRGGAGEAGRRLSRTGAGWSSSGREGKKGGDCGGAGRM
jgi:hypothetical protein